MCFPCFNCISFRREYDGTANRQLISAANISVQVLLGLSYIVFIVRVSFIFRAQSGYTVGFRFIYIGLIVIGSGLNLGLGEVRVRVQTFTLWLGILLNLGIYVRVRIWENVRVANASVSLTFTYIKPDLILSDRDDLTVSDWEHMGCQLIHLFSSFLHLSSPI